MPEFRSLGKSRYQVRFETKVMMTAEEEEALVELEDELVAEVV